MRKKERNIEADHSHICYKPCGISRNKLEKVELLDDEMEAIRLSDYEGLYHEECAEKMNISRSTFSRILAKAHQKIADGLLNKKALKINSN
jgi:predicted DNA-binding protein (UPF0251 family)